MALVSYDYGSDSGEDEEAPEISNSKVEIVSVKPVEVFEDKLEDFIPKAQVQKEKPKVRITIPSLAEFENLNNEEPVSKKRKISTKTSGLLSLLPPVKSVPLTNKSFIPNILKQKTSLSTDSVKKSNAPLIPHSVLKKVKTDKVKTDNDDSDDDIETPEYFDEELWKKSCGKVVKKPVIKEEEPVVEVTSINIAPEAPQPYQGLDNEAFKELVGKSNRIPMNYKLIDINEEELIPEKDLWMTKSLTDPEYIKKAEVEEVLDPTRKKKHHITYLAEQAKANEEDFKNQWAQSKNSRIQTRAKYGF